MAVKNRKIPSVVELHQDKFIYQVSRCYSDINHTFHDSEKLFNFKIGAFLLVQNQLFYSAKIPINHTHEITC